MKSKETCGLIPTGINQIDRAIGGLKCGELSVVASVPNYLSWDFAIKLATNIGIRNKTPMAVFSLEISSLQLLRRLMCDFLNINREGLSKLSTDELEEMIAPLKDAPVYIDETIRISMEELETKIRSLARDYGIKLVIVDYLQLMKDYEVPIEQRQQATNGIIASLKRLARELNLHVLLRNQLIKYVEYAVGLSLFRSFMSFIGPQSVIFTEADNLMMLFEERSSNEVWAGLWNAGLDDIATMKLDLLKDHK